MQFNPQLIESKVSTIWWAAVILTIVLCVVAIGMAVLIWMRKRKKPNQ